MSRVPHTHRQKIASSADNPNGQRTFTKTAFTNEVERVASSIDEQSPNQKSSTTGATQASK
jgi:hypothetical protein